MMNKKKAAACAVAVILLGFFAVSCFNLVNDLNHSFRKGILFADEDGIGFFSDLEQKNRSRDIAAFTIREVMAGNSAKNLPVNGIYVGKNFSGYSMNLIRGNWFTVSGIAEENHLVVIDSRLAVDLFLSVDVVGQEMTVNGKMFQIGGVCELPLTGIRELSTNGNPLIFLAHNTAEDLPVEYLYVSSLTGRAIYPEEQRSYVAEMLEINGASLKATDFSIQLGAINAVPFAFIRLTIAGILIFIAAFVANFAVNTPWREKRRRQIIMRGLVLSGLAGIFAVLTVLLCDLPRIPAEYLPGDSIFNVARYFEFYLREAQGSNALLFNYADKTFLTTFTVLFFESAAALIIVTVLLTIILKKLWKYTKEEI